MPASKTDKGANTITFHLTKRGLAMLWLLIVSPWILAGAFWIRSQSTGRHKTAAALHKTSANLTGRCRPGPWGDVEYTRFILEPPEEYLDIRDTVAVESRWLFKGKTQLEAEQYLQQLGIVTSQNGAGAWEQSPLGVTFKPSPAIIAALSPEIRTRLYGYLGESEENYPQANPYRFRGDKLEEWFEETALRPETIQLVRHYLYRRGTSLAFADGNMVFPQLPDDEERRILLKMLSRRAALHVKLSIRRDSNIQELDAYWSVGGRSKDIKPMLASMMRQTNEAKIDILHLLPRFARSHLNTYPSPLSAQSTMSPLDCHWSALNFFRSVPDDSYSTVKGASKGFAENYDEIVGQPRLGDILALTTPAGGTFHSCVYIADDIVFTKNGISLHAPWILMSLPDMLAYYTSTTELKILIFRPKQRVG